MTTWADTSHYQGGVINDRYPHRIFCFRTNTGSTRDKIGVANARAAKALLGAGKLDLVLPYYFFRPGQANCDLHRAMLEEAGLWGHPRIATMVDVEDAGGVYRTDMSAEINDEVARLRGWYGNDRRVFGYLNAVANAHLWVNRPAGLRFVTPNYTGVPGQLTASVPGWMRTAMFAHQYTDKGSCAPWTGGVDLNYTSMSVAQIADMLGINLSGGVDIVAELNQDQANAVAEGGAQLLRYPGRIRTPSAWLRKILGNSWNDKEGPRFADAFAAVVNEIVWDGYDFTSADLGEAEGTALADTPITRKLNLLSMVRVIGARQRRIEVKLDALLKAQGIDPSNL